MKQGWEIKKLGEICNKITNIKWNEIDKTTSFPYIDLSAVDRENSSIHDYEYINISNAPSRAKQIVKVGDILFATTRPMLKRACIIPSEFNNAIASTGFCVLRPQGTVLSEWIYHNIKSNRFYKYIEPIQKGVSYPAVTDNEVKDFCIPIPPREEQERIVEELDCLSGVIERKREQLKQLDALAQSIFYQMFGDPITNAKGWDEILLKNAAALKAGKAIKANELSETPNNGLYPCYGGNGVRGYINKKSHSGLFPIIGRQGALCGNVVFAQGEFYATEHAVVCNNIIDTINPMWMYYTLRFNNLNRFAQGVAQPGISVNIINEMPLIHPPLTLQQEFAEKIEAIEKQKELIKQSITQTEELFNSRMDYYFN